MWNRVFLSGFLILASLVHTNSISSHSHHHHARSTAVLDTDGNELQAGMPYYIVSAIRKGGGGGVFLDRRERSTSHSSHTTQTPTIKQSSYDMNMGTPVVFSPASSQHPAAAGARFLGEIEEGEMKIQESMDLNVGFSGMNNRVWQVEARKEEESSESRDSMRYVTLGGKPGYPGSSTVRNWFQIERISQDSPTYRIVYCPNVCESCQVTCGSVGINKENSNRWLSVSEHSEFPFVFIRAAEAQRLQ
ncbi:21 kDa seed protein-like [Macadamia integrifolia]|uniref:21 kDa seed protein-like n=1 Tax=Macadamia integrifolia TaxID=60698 RepID=UPI001C4E4BE0|nr:21 kDa seed protein-like [Macadamia integrifolia]